MRDSKHVENIFIEDSGMDAEIPGKVMSIGQVARAFRKIMGGKTESTGEEYGAGTDQPTCKVQVEGGVQ